MLPSSVDELYFIRQFIHSIPWIANQRTVFVTSWLIPRRVINRRGILYGLRGLHTHVPLFHPTFMHNNKKKFLKVEGLYVLENV